MRCTIEPLEHRLFFRSLGIDVSDFQGNITVAQWGQIKAAGKDWAFAKATEGLTFNATTFVNNITRAPQAGVLIGPYHYGRPDNNSAVADADHFIQVISPYLTAGRLRPVLDIEVDAGDVTFMSNWVNDFCNRVKNVTGIPPIVYTGQFFASQNFNSSVTQWPLWIARYPSTLPDPHTASPGSTTPWPTWHAWQYSASGTVPGISGNVDLDVYNGDLAAITAAWVIKPPTATVLRGTTPITDNQSTVTDFGTVMQGNPGPSITFTVRNDGQEKLTLSGLTVPAGYTVTDPLVSSLIAGASDNFTVRLDTAVTGVKSGNITFTTNDPAVTNPFNFPITGNVIPSDTTPPTVQAADFLFETPPHKLTIVFSENVAASVSGADFEVRNLTTNATLSPFHSHVAATFTSTLNFGGTVADGNYRLRVIAAGIQDTAGNVMAADYVYDFFVLPGDANRDRSVNIGDFAILAGNFNQPGTFTAGDFNYNGSVEIGDFSILASAFNSYLAPPADLPRAAGASSPPALLVEPQKARTDRFSSDLLDELA